MNVRLVFVLPLLFASACGAAQPNGGASTEIDALFVAHDAAWNHHDPEELAALFTSDATIVTPSGRRAEAQGEILALFSSGGPTRETTSRMELTSVQWLGDGLALVEGNQALSGPGTAAVGTEARLIAVVRRVDGRFRFVAARPIPGAR